jgi:hypothetical protein
MADFGSGRKFRLIKQAAIPNLCGGVLAYPRDKPPSGACARHGGRAGVRVRDHSATSHNPQMGQRAASLRV